MKLRQARRQ